MQVDKEKLVKIIDFWHGSLNKEKLFDREKIKEINYSDKEIIDIIGPRRSGKSSLFKLIISQFKMKDNFLYVNFEDPFFIENNSAEIIEEIINVYNEYFDGKLKFLFFDEIQSIKNWEKAIRKLRDGTSYKIFITGSSSTLLSQELASLITGRHSTQKMLPLNFREFLFFKKVRINSKKDIILKDEIIKKKFDKYLKSGGFPEVVLSENKELLKDYFYDFLQKDVIIRHDVRDKDALEKMAVFLMSNSSKIVSIASLKKAFNLSYQSAQRYLNYLKESFLIFELGQFSFSLKKQSKALTKIYGVDVGLIREVSFKFSEDRGRILENIIFLQLYNEFNEIYYYKTKNNFEVDFLVKDGNRVAELIQVSWDLTDENTKNREVRALKEAMNELKIKQAKIITYNETGKIKIDNKTINVIPAWKWLLEGR